MQKKKANMMEIAVAKEDVGYSDFQWGIDETNRSHIEELTQKAGSSAFKFLSFLKLALKDNEEVYSEFLKIMSEFKQGSFRVPDLVTKIGALLKGQHELFTAFKTFVPEGYALQEMEQDPVDSSQDALAFIKKIKSQGRIMYQIFLNAMKDFKEGRRSPENVFSLIADLWKDSPELMEDFLHFLPEVPSNFCTPQVKKKASQVKPPHMGDMKGEMSRLNSGSKNCSHLNNNSLPHTSIKLNGRKHKKHADRVKREDRQFMAAQQLVEGNGVAIADRKIVKRLDELERDRPHSHEHDRNAAIPIVNFLRKKVDFLKVVKSFLCQKEKFEEYLKCLEMCSDGVTTHHEFNMQIADMFAESPELIGCSMELVRQCETAELELLLSAQCVNWSYGSRNRCFNQQADEGRKRRKRQLFIASNSNIERENDFDKPYFPNYISPCNMVLGMNYEDKEKLHYEQIESNPHIFKKNPHNVTSYVSDGGKIVEYENSRINPFKENSNKKHYHASGSKVMEHDNCKTHRYRENPHKKSSHVSSKSMEHEKHPSKNYPQNKCMQSNTSKSLEQENSKTHPKCLSEKNLQNKCMQSSTSKSMEQENSKRHSKCPSEKNSQNKSRPSQSVDQENCKSHPECPSENNPQNKSFQSTSNKCEDLDMFSHPTNSKSEDLDMFSHPTNSKSMEQESSKRHPFEDNPQNKGCLPITSNKSCLALDLSKCEQCTPSYRFLPDDYLLPNAGSLSLEGQAGLNNTCVCVTSGSEDYSLKNMHKNEYEEVMRHCEDDRIALDTLIGNASSTVKGLENLLEEVRKKRGKVIVEEHIPARQLRLIEHMYCDCSLEVVECLHQNPVLVAPVILNRVKQKQIKWLTYKAEMNKIWKKVSAHYYQKSLDCHNVYNRQQYLKSFSTKCTL